MDNRSNVVTVSSPVKLMLLGEHAVVYNQPCIVTAVGQRMRAAVEFIEEPVFSLDAKDVQVGGYQKPVSELGNGEIPKGAQFVEIAVKNFLEKYPLKTGVKVTTTSEFSSKFGFGSSSASAVGVVKALALLSKKKLSDKEIFDIAYKTVLDIQGKGSGFDMAAAVYGGTLWFRKGGTEIIPLKANPPLVVGYTGVKADTTQLIAAVAEKKQEYPERVERIFEGIGKLVIDARKAIEEKDWKRLGTLMNFNQDYLRDLGVSSEKLEALIKAASDAGAWGAKLSGAGGGDCMIALHPDGVQGKLSVIKAIQEAGGEAINVVTGADGVRVEN